jgi:hypothetical protein
VKASEDAPKGSSSFFAMQGTAGHSLADTLLNDPGQTTTAQDLEDTAIYVHDEAETKIILPSDPNAAKWEARCENEGYTKFLVADDPQQVEPWAVQMFVDKVRGDLADQEEIYGQKVQLVTEKYLDMSWLHPLFGGTADANFLSPSGWIHLYDYKHGAGIVVEVNENTQLIKYAVGILHEYEAQGIAVKGVKMFIVQPRCSHKDGPIRTVSYTTAELKKWEKLFVQYADRTQKPNAPFRAGDWCTFCPVIATCKEFKSNAQEVARMQFDDAPDVIQVPTDVAELAKVAAWIPMLDSFAKAVDGAIAREMAHGRKVPGFKYVRKKTNRKFGRPADDEILGYSAGDEVPEAEIVKLMASVGIKPEELYKPQELLTLPQMEKLSPKAKKAIKAITYKPEGGLTVVLESDPREAVEPERNEFPDDLGDPTDG